MTPMHTFKDNVEEKRGRAQVMRVLYHNSGYDGGVTRMNNIIKACTEVLESIHHGFYDEGKMSLKIVAAQQIPL